MNKTHNPLKDRLESELLPIELEQIPEMFVDLLIERNIDPTKQPVNAELAMAVVAKMAFINHDWKKLGMIADIWDEPAILQFRGIMSMEKRQNSVHLLAKMKRIRDANAARELANSK